MLSRYTGALIVSLLIACPAFGQTIIIDSYRFAGGSPPVVLLGDDVPGLASGAFSRQIFASPARTNVWNTATSGFTSFAADFNMPNSINLETLLSIGEQNVISDSVRTHTTLAARRPTLDTTATGFAYLVLDDNLNQAMYNGRELARKIWFNPDSLGNDSLTIFLASWPIQANSTVESMKVLLTSQRHDDTRFHLELMYNNQSTSGEYGNECLNVDTATKGLKRMGPACNTAVDYSSTSIQRDSVWSIYEIVYDSAAAVTFYRDGMFVDSAGTPGKLENQNIYNNNSVYFCGSGNADDSITGRCTVPLIWDRVLTDTERNKVRDSLRTWLGMPAFRDSSVASGDEFTIVHITDTQFYSNGTWGARARYVDSMITWVKNNKSTWNIKGIVHSGDLVDAMQTTAQRDTAKVWMDSLFSATINLPVVVTIGNHDYDSGSCTNARTRTHWTGTVMPDTRYTGASWWHANSTRRGFFTDNGRGVYNVTEVTSGDSLLWIGIENNADSTVLRWADSLMTNISHKAIVVTHSLLDEDASFDAATACAYTGVPRTDLAISDTLDNHANMWIGFSGHHARGSALRQVVNATESGVFSFFDPLLCNNTGSEDCDKVSNWFNAKVGDFYDRGGFMRLWVVSPSNRRVRMLTYSPYLDRFAFSHYDHVTFSLDNPF